MKDELEISFRGVHGVTLTRLQGRSTSRPRNGPTPRLSLICRFPAALISLRVRGRSGFVLRPMGVTFPDSGSEVSIRVGRGSTDGSTSDFHCRAWLAHPAPGLHARRINWLRDASARFSCCAARVPPSRFCVWLRREIHSWQLGPTLCPGQRGTFSAPGGRRPLPRYTLCCPSESEARL